ncbi:Uncharacterised protein [uncultured archaeon]|nr:Uncharacterised protein [uncultured archaeon]
MLLCLAVGIVISPAGLDEPRPAGSERLWTNVHLEAGGVPYALLGKGGKEAAHNQLVNSPLILLQLAFFHRSGWVNRRVVCSRSLATGRHHLSLEEKRCLFGKGAFGEKLCERPQIDRRRVNGVIGSGVRDEAVGVKPFSNAHGIGCRKAYAAGGGDKTGGIEGSGRLIDARLRLNGLDNSNLAKVCDYLINGCLLPDAPIGMLYAKFFFEIGIDLPIRFGLEGLDLTLPIHYERQGRGLDPSH